MKRASIETITQAQLREMLDGEKKPRGRRWSAAIPTACAVAHMHASKLEATVCNRLTLLAKAERWILHRQVRFPLLGHVGADGRLLAITVDFVLWRSHEEWRAIDAKSKRKSRDWARGAAAFHLVYGRPIEEAAK